MTQPLAAQTGTAIRELRLERGVRQAELARAIKCHPKHLAKVEYGTRNPSPVLLRRIARVLDVGVGDLRQPKSEAA
jgi:transcriptional regulator with XRE-family HTH domain